MILLEIRLVHLCPSARKGPLYCRAVMRACICRVLIREVGHDVEIFQEQESLL